MNKDINIAQLNKYFAFHKLKDEQTKKYIYPCDTQYNDNVLTVIGFLKRKIICKNDEMIKINLNDIANIILKYYVFEQTSQYVLTVIILHQNNDERKFLQQTVSNQESLTFDGKIMKKD